jgi:hypothetical protein
VHRRELAVERNDAALAGLLREVYELLQNVFAIMLARHEDLDRGFHRGQEDVHRELQHHRARRSSDHDHRRGRLRDLRDASPFDHHAGENADDGEENSGNACDVHGCVLWRCVYAARA